MNKCPHGHYYDSTFYMVCPYCTDALMHKKRYQVLKTLFCFDGMLKATQNDYMPLETNGFDTKCLFMCILLQQLENLSNQQLETLLSKNIDAKQLCGFNLVEKTPNSTILQQLKSSITPSLQICLLTEIKKQLQERGVREKIVTFDDVITAIRKLCSWEEKDTIAHCAMQISLNFEKCTPLPPPSFASASDNEQITIPCVRSSSQCPSSSPFRIDQVQFSALIAKFLPKNTCTIVRILMYEEEYRFVVENAKRNFDQKTNETTSGMFHVKMQTKVKIVLTSPLVEIESPIEERIWYGKHQEFSFFVQIPDHMEKKQIPFTASVYLNDVIATNLKFIAICEEDQSEKITVERSDILSVFASYASQDRKKVASIIQGMQKVRPDLNIFFDVNRLISGDDWEMVIKKEIIQRDTLYLFWSRCAKDSVWVEKEWRYALENKGIQCIEPIPLEAPGLCMPPAELKTKHFNDALLYIVNASD